MKFDLDTAWKDTVANLGGSFGLLAVIAGVFYVVPYAATMLWVPGLAEFSSGGFDPNSAAAQSKITSMLANYWWAFLLLAVIQGVGFLSMLSLLRRRSSPTVGKAIENGGASILSYLAASVIMGIGIGIAVFLITFLFAITGIGVLQLAAFGFSLAVTAYALTKFSMTGPVIANEDTLNPLTALKRSWALTKGNSFRLFGFYALLLVAYFVISMLASLVFALIFALAGAEIQLFGQAITSGVMNAIGAILFVCVLAAVHTQLSRLRAPVREAVDGEY